MSRLGASSELAVCLKLDYLKEMLGFLDKRGWSHDEKAQLLTFMEGVIHLTEDGSSREYEEWEEELERAREVGRMYVSIMERKGIEKGIQLGEARGIQLGRAEGVEETAVALLRENVDILLVSRVTGLSTERLRELQTSTK